MTHMPNQNEQWSADRLDVFIDLRSPYSYVAIEPARGFARELDLSLRWRPYGIDIPGAYGNAEARDERALRKVKYIYRDARRLAAPQQLTIRGPKKIYDPEQIHLAMLYAERIGEVDQFIDKAFERFFDHTLDVEDGAAVTGLIEEIGGTSGAFGDFQRTEGPKELQRHINDAESLGVFGVPTFAYSGEIYWGADRLPMLRGIIDQEKTPDA